ncbi:hypothetical protein UlMin_041612 [Ulmus minor]
MKGFSRSHIKPSSIIKDVDDNEQSYQKMCSSNFQNPKKPVWKEAMAPRKKILAKSKVSDQSILQNTHFKKTPTRDSSHERLSEFDDEEEEQELNALVAGLCLRPYDPVTNYLSPRPKFLQYKPGRRRHIFHGVENRYEEIKDGFSRSGSADSLKGIDGSESNCSSFPSSVTSVEGSVKQGDEETEAEEESDEEEEEEEVHLEGEKGVFKTLLLMVVLVLSTSFISSMNSSTPSCNFECSEAFRNGICEIQNHTFEAALKFVSGNVFEHQIGGRQMGSFEVEKRAMEKGTEEGTEEDIEETEPISNIKEGEVLEFREMEDVEVVESGELDLLDEATVGDFEEAEFPDETIEGAMLKSGEIEAVEMVEVDDETKEELDELEESGDIKEVMTGQILKLTEIPDAPVEEVYNEAAEHEEIVAGEAVIVEEMVNENMGFDQTLKHVKFETFSKVAIGVLMLFVSAASLFFGFLFKRRNALKKDLSMGAKPCSESLHIEKDSSPASKPCSKSLILEEHYSVLPSEQPEEFEQVHSLGKNPYPSIYSWEKTGEEYFQSTAPSVQLLGEYVVQESKSCSTKIRMIESEESNYSLLSDKIFWGETAHSAPIRAHQTNSELSATDFPSNASHIAEQKSLKKEEDGEVKVKETPGWRSSTKGEGKAATPTPVRRSSRIRNRVVLSP